MAPKKGKRNPANPTNQPSDNSDSNIQNKTKASAKKTGTKPSKNKFEFKVATLKKSEKKDEDTKQKN